MLLAGLFLSAWTEKYFGKMLREQLFICYLHIQRLFLFLERET